MKRYALCTCKADMLTYRRLNILRYIASASVRADSALLSRWVRGLILAGLR
jgi:hypothetical protein